MPYHLLGGAGQIHMRSWIQIGKVYLSRPKDIYLRRGSDIKWGIDLVPGVGKEFSYSSW